MAIKNSPRWVFIRFHHLSLPFAAVRFPIASESVILSVKIIQTATKKGSKLFHPEPRLNRLQLYGFSSQNRNEQKNVYFLCLLSHWRCHGPSPPSTERNRWNVLDSRLDCVLQFIVCCCSRFFVCFGSRYSRFMLNQTLLISHDLYFPVSQWKLMKISAQKLFDKKFKTFSVS